MAVLTITVSLLLSGFLSHVVLWRFYPPTSHTGALIIVFSLNFAAFIIVDLLANISQYGGFFSSLPNFSFFDFALILSGYVPACLVYIILYSLLEQESPTLRIMEFIHEAGEKGVTEKELVEQHSRSSSLSHRLQKLIAGGFLSSNEDNCGLTGKGHLISRLFRGAEIIFNIRDGG